MKNHQLIILIILIGIYSAGCAQVFTEPEPLTLPTITSQTEWDSDSILILDSGQRLGEGRSWDISLGDLDRDGNLDPFVASGVLGEAGSAVWLNDGQGVLP